MAPIKVSIVIPTQRRPQGLMRAADSVLRQRNIDPGDVELIIVDNDLTPSARPLAMELAAAAPFPVAYVHEARSGVATARNAGVAAAAGGFIAFLDDDEEACADWLAALLETQSRYCADVVFGPVLARAPGAPASRRLYLEKFFSRDGPAESGPIDKVFGCGDSLIRRAALPDPTTPFAPMRDHTGGEDDLLFSAMRAAGARFAWAARALVFEHPARERLTLAYALARAFAYGQGPTAACAAASPPDRVGVARWMGIGLLQSLFFGALALARWSIRSEGRAEALDRAVRGLGKLLWWGPFQARFYGRAD